MGKLTDSFRTLRVFNPHDFYGGDTPREQVWIGYRSSDRRSPILSAWMVYRKGYKTDPDGHWADYGNKAFVTYGGRERRAEALAEAQAWAAERYGVREWAKDPFGSYGDAEFVKARTGELKRLVKESSAFTSVAPGEAR